MSKILDGVKYKISEEMECKIGIEMAIYGTAHVQLEVDRDGNFSETLLESGDINLINPAQMLKLQRDAMRNKKD